MRYQIDDTKFSSVFAVPSLSEQLLCTASREALQVLLYLMQASAAAGGPGVSGKPADAPAGKGAAGAGLLGGAGFPDRERAGRSQRSNRKRRLHTGPSPLSSPGFRWGCRAQKRTMAIDEIHHPLPKRRQHFPAGGGGAGTDGQGAHPQRDRDAGLLLQPSRACRRNISCWLPPTAAPKTCRTCALSPSCLPI